MTGGDFKGDRSIVPFEMSRTTSNFKNYANVRFPQVEARRDSVWLRQRGGLGSLPSHEPIVFLYFWTRHSCPGPVLGAGAALKFPS